jgi:hypothetical protein
VNTWKAQCAADLDEISGVVHDAWFDADELVHDRAAGTLAVPFAQESEWQGAPRTQFLRRTWRYTEERVPFMHGVLRVGHVVAVSQDENAGDAAMLLGVRYDESTRRVTVEGVSGSVTAVVERLDVTAELHPDEVALYVRRRRSHIFGAESDVPLWGDRRA